MPSLIKRHLSTCKRRSIEVLNFSILYYCMQLYWSVYLSKEPPRFPYTCRYIFKSSFCDGITVLRYTVAFRRRLKYYKTEQRSYTFALIMSIEGFRAVSSTMLVNMNRPNFWFRNSVCSHLILLSSPSAHQILITFNRTTDLNPYKCCSKETGKLNFYAFENTAFWRK